MVCKLILINQSNSLILYIFAGSVVVEEGAEWIHGGWRNPVYRFALEVDGVDAILPDDAYGQSFFHVVYLLQIIIINGFNTS